MELTKEQKDKLEEARDILGDIWNWKETDEGFYYWSEVSDRLNKYINQKEICKECGREK